MNNTVAELFVIMAIDPEKGRITIDKIHFRYPLAGALLMDYLGKGEFSVEKKRVIPSFSMNGQAVHDMISEKIMNSNRNRRISTWIRIITRKHRMISGNIISGLEKQKVISIEHKKFLNILPYNKYWFIDKSIRINTIDHLRGILLHGKRPEKSDIMLLGIIDAARAYKMLASEFSERRILRRKNSELLADDVMSSEIALAVREIKAAIIASVTAATIATHGSH